MKNNKYKLKEVLMAALNKRLWLKHTCDGQWHLGPTASHKLSDIKYSYDIGFAGCDVFIGDEPPEPEVKPLFPCEGGYYIALSDGRVIAFSKDGQSVYSEIGRTSDTKEGAELIVTRDRARAYCLERINEVNEGNNGFVPFNNNYSIYWDSELKKPLSNLYITSQHSPTEEYIRTGAGARKLLNNEEFMKNWKIWKGIKVS
jgi:hypothetical protein